MIVLTCTSCGLCSDTQPVHTNISDTKVTAIKLSTCYYTYSWRMSILLLLLQFPLSLHCNSSSAPFSFVLNDSQPQKQIPYSRKYWREVNLAVEPKITIARILADLNLTVWYGIAIRIYRVYVSRKFWQILI